MYEVYQDLIEEHIEDDHEIHEDVVFLPLKKHLKVFSENILFNTNREMNKLDHILI